MKLTSERQVEQDEADRKDSADKSFGEDVQGHDRGKGEAWKEGAAIPGSYGQLCWCCFRLEDKAVGGKGRMVWAA